MIFANHAHVFPKEIRPEGSVDSLLRFMDECGIDKAVAFAPFDDRFHEGGFEGSQNVWLANEIKGQDRLVGFGTIDFHNNLMPKNLILLLDILPFLGYNLGVKALKEK